MLLYMCIGDDINMTMQDLSNYIDEKIENNPNEIIFTFYELRVRYNLSEEEVNFVIKLSENKFRNLGYKVYLTGQTFEHNGKIRKVESNQLMVAIKE